MRIEAVRGRHRDVLLGEVAGVAEQLGALGQLDLDRLEVLFELLEGLTKPTDSREHGIEVVYQDLALADQQPVYMNLFLGRELVRGPLRRLDRAGMASRTQKLLDELDIRVPSPRATIRDLSGGQRQGVAIARATHWAESLVLMDEPTAALGVQETGRVEQIILRMRQRGRAILIVSHSLDQVFRIADRVCVLRRGQQFGIKHTKDTNGDEIVSMITGLRRA
ncbi:MAG: ATP-binding cassette domain-containing protein [Thermoleophilaceae bacterium]